MTGVKYDKEAAVYAANNADCLVSSTTNFHSQRNKASYDALHLGDVLDNLPEPAETLRELLAFVKPGGLLFVEGPLQTNPSPVFWAARLFGAVKRRVNQFSEDRRRQRISCASMLPNNWPFFTQVGPGLARLH